MQIAKPGSYKNQQDGWERDQDWSDMMRWPAWMRTHDIDIPGYGGVFGLCPEYGCYLPYFSQEVTRKWEFEGKEYTYTQAHARRMSVGQSFELGRRVITPALLIWHGVDEGGRILIRVADVTRGEGKITSDRFQNYTYHQWVWFCENLARQHYNDFHGKTFQVPGPAPSADIEEQLRAYQEEQRKKHPQASESKTLVWMTKQED